MTLGVFDISIQRKIEEKASAGHLQASFWAKRLCGNVVLHLFNIYSCPTGSENTMMNDRLPEV
jgi:hypothetical protein